LKLLFLIPILILASFSCALENEAALADKEVKFIKLFSADMNKEVSCYRIPAIIKTQNGSLIAAIDQRNISCGDLRSNKDINIVIRTSNDNGESWSDIQTVVDYPLGESASDPSMILDRTSGEIFLFFNYMNLEVAPDEYLLKFVSSKDHGISWSNPIDITNQISKPSWDYDFKFITSGRGIQTRSGTLLHTLVNLKNGLYVFGSDDHGKNWFIIDTPISPGDESKIIELNDGSWMINSRVNNSGLRYIHTSNDKGYTWNTHPDSTLIDPSCNASLIRYTSIKDGDNKNRILFSNANSKGTRENLSIKISYDEGKTWKYSKSLYAGKSAYSSLCILEHGTIGVLFEKDDYQEIVFVKLTLDWLTDGKDSL
jgi:sialidase-1